MSEVSYQKFNKFQNPFIEVPLDDLYLHFYRKKYANDNFELDGSNNGPFPGLIDLVCEKKHYRKYKIKRRLPGKKLTILLPERLRHAKVTEDSLILLKKLLENIFKESFLFFVNGAVECGSSEGGAVHAFLDKYEIDDDLWEFNRARMIYRRAMSY